MILRAAILLLVLTMLVSAAIIVPVPNAPVAGPLRDSFKPETTTVVAPILKSVKGKATWFDAERGGQSSWYVREGYEFYAAAGPALREIKNFKWGKKPYRIRVENLKNGKTIVAWVVDWCQCRGQTDNEKLVDLSPAAFTALGVDLNMGVQRVRVTVLP